MSTVPEVMCPSHCRDFEFHHYRYGNEESIDTISHDEVLEAAQKANQRNLIKSLILNY
jgi:purine-nucleoside phosphorylase